MPVTMSSAELANIIRHRERFLLRGLAGTAGGGLASSHRLRGDHQDAYRADLEDGKVIYTVYSFETPIAWLLADGSFRAPEVFYSKTTAKHQGIARGALPQL